MSYAKVKEIDRGSFGVVDEVVDATGKHWARKTFVPPNLPGVSNDDMKARFEREVRYQKEINSPNVVKILDFDLSASPPWFVMELAECSLADEIANDRTLGGDPRKPLFDVLAGLEGAGRDDLATAFPILCRQVFFDRESTLLGIATHAGEREVVFLP